VFLGQSENVEPTMSERDIFTAARWITDPVARAAFLAEACGGDAALHQRVEVLLRADATPDSFLDVPAVSPPSTDSTIGEVDVRPRKDLEEDLRSFLEPPSRPDTLGRLGHYEVLEVLGRGGFGIVLRAFDETLQRVVAVKVLAPHLAVTSPACKRFLREARCSAAVQHDNVVQVYAVEEQPLPYLVMEYIPGETLQQRLDRVGPLEVPEVLRIGRQIAEGLAAAHATGLIHRDVKPANVLVERGSSERVKLTDFGLARAADDASITESGLVAGTPLYMSPEQARGEALDARSDLFSLGSVLYAMTTGRPPFRAANAMAVLKRVNEDTPRPIPDVIPETPAWLCDLIARLHAKDREVRFQSAEAVADLLTRCLEQGQPPSGSPDLATGSPDRRDQPVARWSRRRSRWEAVAGVVLLAGLVLTETTGVTRLCGTVVRLWTSEARTGPEKVPGSHESPPVVKCVPAGMHALYFDGIASHVEIPILKRETGKEPITLEAWVRPDEAGANDVAVVLGGSGRCQLGRNRARWEAIDFTGGWLTYEPAEATRSVHLAYCSDGKIVCFFLDGKLVSAKPIGTYPYAEEAPVLPQSWIGAHPVNPANEIGFRFKGTIHEVRISSTARYESDFTPRARHEPDRDTLALYHCDEGTGDRLLDSSGHEHHGKIVDAKWVVDGPFPFPLPEIDRAQDEEVLAFAARSIPGTNRDDNAQVWNRPWVQGPPDTLAGDWEYRWKGGVNDPWVSGFAEVKLVGDRIFFLCREGTGKYLMECRRGPDDRIVGRYMNLGAPKDNGPFVGRCITPERIDGYWPSGRWDFRRTRN
jgi:serine/threonine protein kinase